MLNKKIIFITVVVLGFLAVASNNVSAAICGSNNEGLCVDGSSCLATTQKITGTCEPGQICCKPKSSMTSSCSSLGGGCVDGDIGCDPDTELNPINDECEADSKICCKNGGVSQGTSAPVAPTGGSETVDFPNPIKASTMSEFLGNVLNALLGVVAFISLIFIIIGAVMYMVSAGNEQAIERAKKTITGAVVGLAIAAAAPTFLKEIKKILGGASGTNADDIVNKAYTLKDIAINVLNFLLSVTGIVAIIGLIVGAIFYLTSYGDEERMEKGKKILAASIIGIIVAFSALVIVRQVANLIAVQ